MAQMTMIARVVDGLPLVGTMQDDEQVSYSRCNSFLEIDLMKSLCNYRLGAVS